MKGPGGPVRKRRRIVRWSSSLRSSGGTLRVTGGVAWGRRLRVPQVPGLRPTREAVREALFDILGGDVRGCRVLDLYAGSGALGIEALSRGAKWAVFVESDAVCAGTIRENLERCSLTSQAVVIRGSLPTALRRVPLPSGERFDLVLLDPPYASSSAEATLEGLVRFSLLAEDARIVWEHGSGHRPLPPTRLFLLQKDRTYGNTTLSFLIFAPGERESDGERE